jgi:urate oxidase / 2-oxo-4-hydroxy-4-carboxy-5-ureidoimidazoline decarboxylase
MQISYGKFNIALHRFHAAPLTVAAIPESGFVGRGNTLFTADVSVEVFGDNFLPAYTHGDNSMVVATDSMKNFILREAAQYTGATLEGLLAFLGERFLATYAQMQSLEMSGYEIPFEVMTVATDEGLGASKVLFGQRHDHRAFARLRLERNDTGITVVDHEAGRVGLQLLKLTGSSFAAFVRDDYTTLPELKDRPLFIDCDVFWQYTDSNIMLDNNTGNSQYVPSEQILDIFTTVFDEFNSKSIQELVYVVGKRILARFGQLKQLRFLAHNRTWDKAAEHDERPEVKVYWKSRDPYGHITLIMNREDITGEDITGEGI